MSIEFWFTICATFLAILIEYFSKKKSFISKMAICITAVIAITSFILGLANFKSEEKTTDIELKEEVKINYSEENSKMFTNYFETHEVATNQINFQLEKWNMYEDKDIKALSHENEEGIKLKARSTFMVEGEEATSDIHLTYNSEYKGNTIMSGKIVTMNETSSSNSIAKVSILIDGNLAWTSDKTITGRTVEPIEFSIDTKGCKNEVIIRFEYYMKKDGLSIAIFEK